MPVYEVTFRTSPVSDAQEEQLLTDHEAMIVVDNHGGTPVTLVTMADECEGCDGTAAALTFARQLNAIGITVYEIHADLVTASDIASRSNCSRQAVNLWIRGDRKASTSFPAPANLVRGGVWRWNEVNDWLAAQGKECDSTVTFLSREEEICANYRLRVMWKASGQSWHSEIGLRTGARVVAKSDIRWTGMSAIVEFSVGGQIQESIPTRSVA